MKKLLSSMFVLAALAIAPALHATPINGQFSVTGASVQDTGTQLIFNPNTINVGAQNTIMGDFTSILTAGEAGTITSPINYASYVAGSSALTFGSGSSLLTLTLNSISCSLAGSFNNCIGGGTMVSGSGLYDPTQFSLLHHQHQRNRNLPGYRAQQLRCSRALHPHAARYWPHRCCWSLKRRLS